MTNEDRFGPTMLHGAVLMIGLALLSATVLPIHRAIEIRACEEEMLVAMSFVKVAQDRFYAEHGRYAGPTQATPVTEEVGLGLTSAGFPRLRYLQFKDLILSVNQPEADGYRLFWLLPELRSRLGLRLAVKRIEMNQDGRVY